VPVALLPVYLATLALPVLVTPLVLLAPNVLLERLAAPIPLPTAPAPMSEAWSPMSEAWSGPPPPTVEALHIAWSPHRASVRVRRNNLVTDA
jgi:hypothetical protein